MMLRSLVRSFVLIFHLNVCNLKLSQRVLTSTDERLRGVASTIGLSTTDIDTYYNQRADQYKVLPGMCECAATAEAAEQGGGRGVGLVGVPCHGGS